MMSFRNSSHIRLKIIALLASMTALWAFAAVVTVRDGLNLLFVNTVGDFGVTTSEVVSELQAERRLSVVVLGGDDAVRDELAAARQRTDQVIGQWRDEAGTRSLRMAASEQLRQRIGEADVQLRQLARVRTEIDESRIDRRAAGAALTVIIDAKFDIFATMSVLDDEEIARQSRALVGVAQVRELLSQQDALLSGVLAAGEVTDPDVAEFTQLVGAKQFRYDTAVGELAPADQALFETVVSGAELTALGELEDQFIREARGGEPAPFPAEQWQEAVAAAGNALRAAELTATDNVLDRAMPVAAWVIVRLLLAGGLGLIAVIAAIVVSITTARTLVRQLERLRDAARELASDKLPRVVDRLSKGEEVNVAAEAPPLRFGDDEIGQVGQAFNAVQETAVRAAVQQAALRHGVRDVFLSLARRTQSLVHKQLGVVDGMERRETDPDEMADLYRIDHLATRMRRNAENLIVLSGATPGRTWREPVSMIDVIRGAIGETEDYQRVNLMPVQDGALEGPVVGDLIHLLAELIENAASFSPPYAAVGVGGQRVAHGFVVEIEDRGLGMSEEELAEVNQRLADPPDFSLADASRLGHYVVARLAQRHGVRVHLRASPYGGVTAIVLIPQEILADGAEPLPQQEARPSAGGGGSGRAPVASGRVAVVSRPADPQLEPPPPRPAAGAGRSGEAAPAAAAAEPEDAGNGANGASRTPAGLPWRVRQASLPKQLIEEQDADEPPAWDPEQVRKNMSSYQLGTQRGRAAGDRGSPTEDSPGAQPGDREGG